MFLDLLDPVIRWTRRVFGSTGSGESALDPVADPVKQKTRERHRDLFIIISVNTVKSGRIENDTGLQSLVRMCEISKCDCNVESSNCLPVFRYGMEHMPFAYPAAGAA